MTARERRASNTLITQGLDALLVFKQESMYWLTGYDTFGFSMFQCLVLTADRQTALLTRAPDHGTALYTSNIRDIRIWVDQADSNPASELQHLLDELGLRGGRIGIELDSYGLTAFNWRLLETQLDGFVDWIDASSLIQELRRNKSSQEIEYIRRAATLADDAWDAATSLASAGTCEATILSAMQGAVLQGGGDYGGNEMIIGSGPGALMVRYTSGRRHLDRIDQLTLEWCGVERRYHAAMMRTLLVGEADATHQAMHQACVNALVACEETVVPGNTMGDVFEAHARVLDEAGYRHHRMNACGYGMGAVYAPIWVDWPMFYADNTLTLNANQVYFLHMILLDREKQKAMTLGHSVLVTEQGCERLSRSSLELAVN